MAVKISSLSSGSLQGTGGSSTIERTDASSDPKSSNQTTATSTDTISLTSSASQLQQLESRITQMSVVDAQLVEEVQRQLATGSFRIDPDRSASKLLSMETSLP
ncbi:MAG: flagellar biosynthesis anti-sigma factor FlgM [Pseudomonadota bacterium]